MRKRKTTDIGWWKRMKHFMKTYTSLTVIIVAGILLELTTGVLYFTAQNNMQNTMERLVKTEMNAIHLSIRNKLVNVEVTLNNMAWVVQRDLGNANWMFDIPTKLVENNAFLRGSAVAFAPNYYPRKGRWFEPTAIRRKDGTIELKQVGSAHHDYTKAEFYTVPMKTGRSHWCEPYMDKDGSKEDITTYGVPVRTEDGKTVAVVIADIALDWLDDIMKETKVYKSTQRFLTTGSNNHLAGEVTPEFGKALKLIKDDKDRDGYFTMKNEKGQKQHVFYTPIGGQTDWMLIIILDDSEVFGRLRLIRMLLLMPVMIGLIFAGFVVWRSSRNLERLRKVNAEKDRIGGELRVAREIQQSMLPQGELYVEGLDLEGFLKPAREVGGDLFDYFLRDEKLFFCIGDVSGKGAPAAMLMAVTHGLFRSAAAHENNPDRIMEMINEVSCQGNESNMFVTLFIGVLDLPTGRLRYCDAGHDAPFMMTDGQWAMMDVSPYLPVGVFDDTKYGVQEVYIRPQSTIFLYTDGLTEAMNAKHQQFGVKRVQEVLSECNDKSPGEILEIVTEAVDDFMKKAEQNDDLTLLAFRYTPKK